MSYVLLKNVDASVPIRLFFLLPLIFNLLAASISRFLNAALKFHVFLPTKFVTFIFHLSL